MEREPAEQAAPIQTEQIAASIKKGLSQIIILKSHREGVVRRDAE